MLKVIQCKLDEKIDALMDILIESGLYGNKTEIIRDGLRRVFRAHKSYLSQKVKLRQEKK